MKKTHFFEKVWHFVEHIPYGKVVSYGQIAAVIGHPRAARTVGWAMHAVPEDRELPWHRVINSQGRVSTSCPEHGGGLQEELLKNEGVIFSASDRIDMDMFQWRPDTEQIDAIVNSFIAEQTDKDR